MQAGGGGAHPCRREGLDPCRQEDDAGALGSSQHTLPYPGFDVGYRE